MSNYHVLIAKYVLHRTVLVQGEYDGAALAVLIDVDTADVNTDQDGTTEFSRTYEEDTEVTFTAPGTSGGKIFKCWNIDGTDQTVGERDAVVTM